MRLYSPQVKRLKEKEVIWEMSGMEEYIDMEEELTNDQDSVVNNIRDVTSRLKCFYYRFEALKSLLALKF